MKTLKTIVAVLSITIILSCGKKSSTTPNGQVAGTISIEGTVYPTITIGSQVWTTINFSGTGTVELLNIAGNVSTYGNYYGSADGIILPNGWRVPTRNDYDVLLSNYNPIQTRFNGDIYFGTAVTEGLNSTSGWINLQGTNTSGFNALPAGFAVIVPFSTNTASPQSVSNAAYFLTSDSYITYDNLTGKNDNMTYALEISDKGDVIFEETQNYSGITHITNDDSGLVMCASLRFVKDN